MVDATARVFPQDEGTGLTTSGDADYTSAAHFAGLAGRANASNYVEAGLGFTADYTNNLLDIGAGVVFILQQSDASVQDGNGDYTETWSGPIRYACNVDVETGIALTDAAVNHVYVAVDPTTADRVYYEVNTTATAPSDPSLKIGEVDTSANSATEQNRVPDLSVGTLDAVGDITAANDYVEFAGNRATFGEAVAIAHADLSSIASDDHHTRFAASGAGDRLSDIPTRPHSDLTNVGSDQHHTRYADSEARSAVTGNVNIEDLVTASATAGHVARSQGDGTLLAERLAHGDLSGISAGDHHSRYADEEAQDAVGTILSTDFNYDDATPAIDMSPHAGDASAHHAKYTDSEAQTAINNDADHGSTAPHNYFSGSHNDLTNVGASDHHTKTTSLADISDADPAQIIVDTLANQPVAGTVNRWHFTTDNNGIWYDDGAAWQLIAEHPSNIGAGDLAFDPATQSELDSHAGTSNAHHAKYTDSEAQTAINNDADHGSTAPHNYFSGSHTDLTNVGSSDHHTRFGASGAGDRLSDIPTRPHGDLTNIGTDQHHARDHATRHHSGGADEITHNSLAISSNDHHSRYADSEAVSAAESQDPLSPQSLSSQGGLSVSDWQVIDVSNNGFPGDQTGGDLGAWINNQLATDGKYVFILPDGDYDWNTRCHMVNGANAYQPPRPHTFVIIGKPDATIHVDLGAGQGSNGEVFNFGNSSTGVQRVSLQNLHFDVSDGGTAERDAGIMQAYIRDHAYFSNISMSVRKKVADDGTSNGPRHTFNLNCVEQDATALCERIKFPNGDVWNSTYPDVNYAIPIASEPPHVGKAVWRDCYVNGFHDNGYYLRDGTGSHHVESCTAEDCGVSGFRFGRNDHAENVTVIVNSGGVQRSCTGLWLQEHRDTDPYTVGDEYDSPIVVDGFELLFEDNAAADNNIQCSGDVTHAIIKNGYVHCGYDDFALSASHATGQVTYQNVTVDDHATGNTRVAAIRANGDNVTFDDITYRPFPPTGENGRSIFRFDGVNIKVRDSHLEGTYTPMVETYSGADFTIEDCYCPHDGSFTDPYVVRANTTPVEFMQLRNNRMGDYTGGLNVDLANVNNHYLKNNGTPLVNDAPGDIYTNRGTGYEVQKSGTNAEGILNFDPEAGEVTIDGVVVATGPGMSTVTEFETWEGGTTDETWGTQDLTIGTGTVYSGSYAAYATSGGGNQRLFDYEGTHNNLSRYPRYGDKVRTFFYHPTASSSLTGTTRIRWAYGGDWGNNYVIQCNLYNQNIRIWEGGLTTVIAGPSSWSYPGATWFALESEWSSTSPHHTARVMDYSDPNNPTQVVEITGDSTTYDDTSSGAYWGADESGGSGDFWVDHMVYFDE